MELKEGKKVKLCGYIHEIRDLAKIKFFLLRNFNGIVQCVVKKPEVLQVVNELTLESVVELSGIVRKAKVKSEEVSVKDKEIEIEKLKILNKAEQLPILVNEKKVTTSLAKRLDFRCLDLRKPKVQAIFKISNCLIRGMQEYLEKNEFVQVFTPCLMGVASESGAEVFEVEYFDRKAYLRQDPQLHRQLTILGGFEKIYDLGPNWRAELSHTTKHLTEHRAIAVEQAFIEDEHDVMKTEQEMLRFALKKLKKECKEELNLFDVNLNLDDFPELKFPKVYDILEKYEKNIRGRDLDSEAEKILAEYVKKKYGADFFFLNGFPFKIKPFYVYHDSEYARSVDLYLGNIELSSGGQREHRYGVLVKNIKEKGMSMKSIEWFVKFFKYGAPPHGGFAIGIERLLQALLRLENIREACLFPRDPERILP